ncbi:uncharacterized protein [Lolium perenne]|uniref:uncharacterized protein n=1 Tax=Lolium perenne TaxID=4522 RepID=UPI0021EB342B|nr:uncharacterized protein LOC127340985 [Lolium perenne]
MDLEQGAIPLVDKEEQDPTRMEEQEEEEEGEEEDGSGSRSSINLAMLTDKSQLERLALLLRNNEEALMRRVMRSEQERVEYIRTVTDAYRLSVALLQDCTTLREESTAPEAAPVARDVHDYVIYGLNLCMQNVRNCCMRVDVLGKLRAHYDALAQGLADDPAAVAAEAAEFRASMWEYCYSHRSAAARARSRDYSNVLRLEGVDLPELLRRQQVTLGPGYAGDFEDLKDSQKLEVYNSVIVASGRAKLPDQLVLSGRSARKGKTLAEAISVFIMAAGNMVYDVYTAEHNAEAILRGSLNVMAAVGAFAVDVAVTGAVTKAVANAGAALFACSLAGFVVGAIAGLIFITVSGRLIDLIIGSPRKVPPIRDLKFHTAVMPDGMTLANQIARQ